MKKYYLKITCKTPKNKADSCIKTFGNYFHLFQKPIKTEKVAHNEFYYVYEYEKEKERYKVVYDKIPKAEETIRNFYSILIHLLSRGKKLQAKSGWALDKAKRWIMGQLKKKVKDTKDMDELLESTTLDDRQEMVEFLSQPLFEYEEWEDDVK